jgi:hypothetical protein
MWNPVATRLQPFIKAMAHVDGIAAADVRPQRSPHCEQTAVIIGPLRGFACSA